MLNQIKGLRHVASMASAPRPSRRHEHPSPCLDTPLEELA